MKKILSIFCALSMLQSFSLLQGKEIVTSSARIDGFGAQFQTVVCAAIYAEFHNQEFRYTPFKEMVGNYNNDEKFLEKIENLINFIGNFDINYDSNCKEVGVGQSYAFFDANMGICVKSQALKMIKKIFRDNKKNNFNKENLNIAVHIRRPNRFDDRLAGADTPDQVYLNIINHLRSTYASKKPLFHIYSQGNLKDFELIYKSDDVIFHLDEPLESTFTEMVLADVLVTSQSSFSYVAGFLSEGTVYYMPFWHPPLPHWIPF